MAKEEKVTVPVVKPGWKTTEFWAKFVPQLLGIAVLFGWVEPNSAAAMSEGFGQMLGGAMLAFPEVAYSISRGVAKHNAPVTQIIVKSPRPKVTK